MIFFNNFKVGVKHQSINLATNHSITLRYKLSISRSTGKKSNNVDMENNHLKQHSATFVYLKLYHMCIYRETRMTPLRGKKDDTRIGKQG